MTPAYDGVNISKQNVEIILRSGMKNEWKEKRGGDEEREVMYSIGYGKSCLSSLLSSITDQGMKDDDELANFPKLPVDALESDKLPG